MKALSGEKESMHGMKNQSYGFFQGFAVAIKDCKTKYCPEQVWRRRKIGLYTEKKTLGYWGPFEPSGPKPDRFLDRKN